MQYILTEEEYRKLKQQDSKFDELCMILHNIDNDLVDDKSKLKLFRTLVNDLGYSSQNGTTEAALFAWNSRKSMQI
jgi:hypothetical protein